MKRLTLLLLLSSCLLSTAKAEQITVMISGGFSAALNKLAPQYEAATGDTIRIIYGPSMGNSPEAIPQRLAAGEAADAVIMVGYALNTLQQAGKIIPGSRTELADSRIGMVVRAGATRPDISSITALKATLLKAKSIAYSDSASGSYIQKALFRKLGITEQMMNKASMIEKTPVAEVVAKGDYEMGFQQVSELLPVKGAEYIGRIPDSVQFVTRFSGGVVAGAAHPSHARQLLRYLASSQVQQTVRETGLDPLTTKAETAQ